MAASEEEIIVCYACAAPMNIAKVAPYSRVVCPACNAENRVKKQFGPYVLTRLHAIGGMSSVFIANDETLGREVALKILSEEYSSDEKRIAAFEQEARLTASFSHPNVVRVLTTGRAFGRFYIAMEFVPGGHFEHQIRERGKIPEIDLLPLAIQVAEGLKGAHSAGLIHRDVKPGNILLDSEGHAKIVDFGLALVTQGGKATATEIWATPYYVPPEAIEGQAEDFRSDIYAFGATFYHALAGSPSCDEESMATDVLREAKKRVVPLKRIAPHLLDETCAVIDRTMAYEPIRRFGSYDDLISGLKNALKAAHGETVKDHEGVTKAERRTQLRQAKGRRNLLIGSAVVLGVAGLLTFILVNSRKDSSGKPSQKISIVESVPAKSGGNPVEIASSYRAARKAMNGGNFRKAENRFATLLLDGAVQEPTRTWAGVQAIVAAMMDGRMDSARKRASLADKHLKTRPAGLGYGFHAGIRPVISGLHRLEFFDPKNLDLGSSGNERFMGYFIAGLKNWEQGGLEQAVPFFRKVVSERKLSSDSVLGLYQEAARTYLKDYDLLVSAGLNKTPQTPQACRASIDDLNRVLTLLDTRGRARFNVRARQQDLVKLEKALKNPVVPEADVMDEIDALVESYRFADVVEALKNLKGDLPGGKRKPVLQVAQKAQVFMADIEAALRAKPVSVPLKLKDGTDVSSLVIPQGKKLTAKLSNGVIRELKWEDFPADQLLVLHRALEKPAADDLGRLHHQISAIAFDWIAGDRKRAETTADSLSEKNEQFEKLWSAISAELPDS
ncbi:MAG: serine/threonine-protein kinase [Akkermansiaceae bacterium]|nr:serine/threonine-protein kinase [Akkermansiaceae bacterium]